MLYQLKIHGYGYQYLFFDESHYFTLALKEMELEEINEIIFDSELLSRLGLFNRSAGLLIDSAYLAEPNETGFLYGMDLITRLEAKPKVGKRIKFKFYDLRNEEMLFGFPNIRTSEFGRKGILVVEKCLGYFGRTKLSVAELQFENLKFDLIHLNVLRETFVGRIYHRDFLLDFEYDELICQSKRVFVL